MTNPKFPGIGKTVPNWERTSRNLIGNSLIYNIIPYGTLIDPMPLSKPYFMKQIVSNFRRLAGFERNYPRKTSSKRQTFSNLALLAATAILALPAFGQNCPASGTHTQSSNENTYYPGTQAIVSAGATTITLGAAGAGANFGNTPIAVGDIVLIIQMQGAQIVFTNNGFYGNNSGAGFGFTATSLSAGFLEYGVAASAVPLAGGTLTLAAGTTNAYAYSTFGAFGQYTYQVIRVPSFYNIQLTATVTTPLWNGSTGAVTALNAVNQLDFNGQTINASGMGFRGGAGRSLNGAGGLNKTDYVTMSTSNANASKAEGIAGTPKYVNNNGAMLTNASEGYPSGSYGRGAPGNAGGGGTDYNPIANDQNDGGGGGANGGNGGKGGNGWFLVGTSGGKGGGNFAAYASPNRLVLGGGGGAGTTNNSTGTPSAGFASSGAAGGGMVLISTTSIIGTGTIDADGAVANNTVTNDASGGGGGGGSILIYAGSGHAGITATANGGVGGSNDPASVGATQHGPGGGGGGGVIYSNQALNVASSVNGGANGISVGTNATDNFGAIAGNVGVLTQTFPFAQLPPNMQKCQIIVLPVTLISLEATNNGSNNVLVSWASAKEINFSNYEVERSDDAVNFTGIGQVNASQSEESTHNYSLTDNISGVKSTMLYYRLKLVDANGQFTYSKVVFVKLDQSTAKISIYPNPAADYAVLRINADHPTEAGYRLMDGAGRQLIRKSFQVYTGSNNQVVDQINSLPKGIYILQVTVDNSIYTEKLIKQ